MSRPREIFGLTLTSVGLFVIFAHLGALVGLAVDAVAMGAAIFWSEPS